MADKGFGPYGGDAESQAKLYQLQLRQRIADAMLQQGMAPISTQGREIGGMAYRISPTEGLSKIAQALLGAKLSSDNATDQGQLQQDYYKSQLAANQPGVSGGYTPQQVSQSGQEALTQGAAAGDVGPTNTNVQRLVQALGNRDPQQPTINPRNPTGMPAELLTRGQLGLDPPEVWKANAAPYAPTEAARRDRELGIDKQTAVAAAMREYAGKGMQNVRPGGTVYDPSLGANGAVFTAPQGGGYTTWKNGMPTESAIPGAAAVAGLQAGAGSIGGSMGKPQIQYDAQGNAVSAVPQFQTMFGQPPNIPGLTPPQGAPQQMQGMPQGMPQGAPQGMPPQGVPQSLIDMDRRGQPFVATQAPGGPLQQQPVPQRAFLAPPQGVAQGANLCAG